MPNPLQQKPKAKAYIDGANMFYTQKKLGWMVDWKKTKSFLEAHYNVLELRYYIGVKDNDLGMKGFVSALSQLGYTLVTKPVKKIRLSPPQKGVVFKADFDVEITRDVLLSLDSFDQLILFSGDSDFAGLIDTLKKQGKKTIVYGSRVTLGWELKLIADQYVYLEDHKERFFRKQWGVDKSESR